VVVRGRRIARRGARRREGVDQRIGETGGAHGERAVAAAEIAGATFPGFLPAEIGQHMCIGPLRQAGVRPAVIVAAMAPHQAQLRELRARSGQVATERRRRERAAHIASRAAVRDQARSGEMPTVSDALGIAGIIPDERPLADVVVFLSSGGEVRLGYATRPGAGSRTSSGAGSWT